MKKSLLLFTILLTGFALASNSNKQIIFSKDAPAPIGSYSQAVKIGNIVFLSGQIGINPQTDQLAEGVQSQINQAFKNMATVATAAGGNVNQIAKLTVFVTDLNNIPLVNDAIKKYFAKPYPARSAVAVAALAKGAAIEVEGIMVLNKSE